MNSMPINVVGLHRGSVWEDIQTHISKFKSIHTRKNYERSLRIFFRWWKTHRDLETLMRDDLYIRNADMLRYQQYLENHEADYTNMTINNMIAAIQSLYRFLEANDYEINAAATRIPRLDDDSERSGFFHSFEIERIPEILYQTVKGVEKVCLVKMAYITSFRKSSLLNLTWNDIVQSESPEIYRVSTIGKGNKKHTVDIPKELYEELLLIKNEGYYSKYTDNKIFHLSNTTIQNMMGLIKSKLDIEESRNIVFHSFRNYASMFGTLEEKRRHYNHSDINITDKYYGRDAINRSSDMGLRIVEKIDDSIFDQITKDELIHLIKAQPESFLFQIKRDAKKLIEDKENAQLGKY